MQTRAAALISALLLLALIAGPRVAGQAPQPQLRTFCLEGAQYTCFALELLTAPSGAGTDVTVRVRNLQGATIQNVPAHVAWSRIHSIDLVAPAATFTGGFVTSADPVVVAEADVVEKGVTRETWFSVNLGGPSEATMGFGLETPYTAGGAEIVGCGLPPTINYPYFQTCDPAQSKFVEFHFSTDGPWQAEDVGIIVGVADPFAADMSCLIPGRLYDNPEEYHCLDPLTPSDTTAPSIVIAAPPPGLYVLGQTVIAAFSCDDGSGIASCVGSVPDGASIDTSSTGSKPFTVTAVDIAGNSATQSVSYTVTALGSPTDLPALGGKVAKAFAINASGTVVGYALNSLGQERPVVWSGGAIAELPRAFLTAAEHRALAINSSGQIAGRSGPAQCGEDSHAVLWQNDSVTDLGHCGPHAYFSRGHGINDAGVVVGYDGDNYGGPSEAFHTVNGVLTRIGRPAGSIWSVANGINASETIAVVASRPNGYGAFSWSNGSFTELPAGGGSAQPNAINAGGVIVGHTEIAGHLRAAQWENGSRVDLPALPGGSDSDALAVNAGGVIAGWSTTAAGETHAVVWVGGLVQDLGAPVGATSHLEATGVNDSGVVAGWYVTATGDTRAFVTAVDLQPPAVACGAADSAWHAGNVSIACTASDAGSGLVDAADASFSLTTGVTPGVETANAQTNARTVCDQAGNCTTVGPIGGHRIDRLGPTIALAAPAAVTYRLHQAVLADYSCGDAGSGVASCTGSLAMGAVIPTSAAGSYAFAVNAADAVGNLTTQATSYAVSAGIPADGNWHALQPLPEGRYGQAVATVDGLVYVIGGVRTAPLQVFGIGAHARSEVYAYDPLTNAWTNAAPLPHPRVYPNGAAVIGTRIYLAGGAGCDAPGCDEASTLFIFDPATGPNGTWGAGPSLPARSMGGSSGAIGAVLYVLAGRRADGRFFSFDTTTQSWTELAPSPRNHTFGAGTALGGKFYAAGGEAAPYALDVFDPATGAWTMEEMPIGFQHHAAAALGGKLYLVGGNQFAGGGPSFTSDNLVMAYDPVTDVWTPSTLSPSAGGPYSSWAGDSIAFDGAASHPLAVLPEWLGLTAATSIGDTLFIMGGNNLANTAALPTLLAANPPSPVAVSFAWDFGDGRQGAGANPAHQYTAPGVYTATLTVTANDGRSAVATASVTVASRPQTIAFTSVPPDPARYGGSYIVAATGGASGSPVVFSSLTPSICTVSGNNVSFIGIGGCTIAANQASGFGYDAAPQVTQAFAITVTPQMSAGFQDTCVLKADGTITCWGSNVNGQTTVPTGLASIVQVSVGFGSQTCALRTDGTLVCWGFNGNGRATIPAGLTSVAQVSAGGSHTCALKTDGTVMCWGYNVYNQATVPAGLSSVAQVAAGNAHTCAVRTDGSVVCWGNNNRDQATVPAGLGSVVQVAAGNLHTCAVKADGAVTCWGSTADGQTAVPAGLTSVAQVASGSSHNCALTTEQTVVCWGFNGNGEATPPTGLTSIAQVSAGWDHTCALQTDGMPVCWGANGVGQSTVPALLNPAQWIVFRSIPPSPALEGSTYTVTARAGGSGNPVVLSSNTPAVCSVSGNAVTLLSGGTCVIAANQAGGNGYNAAATATQTFTVTPLARVARIDLSPTTVYGGAQDSIATVTLTSPAIGTQAQRRVTLSSDNTALATVPANLTLPAGATTATFTTSSLVVTIAASATVSGTLNGGSGSATLTVIPLPDILSVTLSPRSVVGGAEDSIGTVTLKAPAIGTAAQRRVTLTSDNTAVATVPASVTVPVGETTATFTVQSLTVAARTSAGISAAINGGVTSAGLTVNTLPVATSISLSPASVVGGSADSIGTVVLNAPAIGSTAQRRVFLTSGNTTVATVPSSIVVPAGNTAATFTVTSKVVTTEASAAIGAMMNGTTAPPATLTVGPLLVANVTLGSASVAGGTTVTGTITLNAPAFGSVAQRTVAFSSGNPAAATVPATLVVPAGATTQPFTITSFPVNGNMAVNIRSMLNGVPRSAALTVLAPLSCVAAPSSLIHWWTGDNGPQDIVGGDNGLPVGTVSFAGGIVGNAFRFGSGHLQLSQSYGGSSTTETTVMAWIRTEQIGSFPWQAILSSTTPSFLHFQTANSGGSALYTNAQFLQIPSFAPMPLNVWRHVVMTAKSGEIRVYENGVMIGQLSNSFSYITPQSGSVLIGNGYQTSRPFLGLVDELQMYNRALTAGEVQQIYQAGSLGVCRQQ